MSNNFEGYFTDIDFSGKKTLNGDITKYEDDNAFAQAFKFWLASSKGERLRKNKGGVLLPHLQKPMSETRRLDIVASIKNGLENDFKQLNLLKLSVTPDYQKRQWKIIVVGYSPILKRAVFLNETVNNFV